MDGTPPTIDDWPQADPLPRPPGQRNGRAAVAALPVVAAVVARVGLAVVGLAPWHDSGPAHPDVTFDQPVYVDFLTQDQYAERTRSGQEVETEEEREMVDLGLARLRALGLVSGDVDLLEASDDLSDAGTLAYYDPDEERIVVRGTEITAHLRVTLVHELVHALQDQRFDIGSGRLGLATGADAGTAFRAVVEGDAERIEDEYLVTLSDRDREEYLEEDDDGRAAALGDLGGVPAVMIAVQAAPYYLGKPFVLALAADGGDRAVDAALRDPPPSLEDLFDLGSHLAGETPVAVDPPPVPDGADARQEAAEFGIVDWYLLLAARIDPITALAAADGWAGGAEVTYDDGGRTCVGLTFAADTADDRRAMEAAARAWVTAGPAGTASAAAVGDAVHLRSCDPGADGDDGAGDRSLDALGVVAIRSNLVLEGLDEDLDAAQAFAWSDCVVRRLDVTTVLGLYSGDLPDAAAERFWRFADHCREENGG
jgi:hypothetical protein